MKYILAVYFILSASNSSAPRTQAFALIEVKDKATCERLAKTYRDRWTSINRTVDTMCDPAE